MHFAFPLFLWMLPLSLAPLWFHLFMGRRHPSRRFPSLMFFLAAAPRHHARRRVVEWVILCLRCLALALFLLALARPFFRGTGPPGMPVFLVDNAASMGLKRPGGRSRLEWAGAVARQILAESPHHRAGLFVSVADPAVTLSQSLEGSREAVLDAVSRLRPTHAAGNPLSALHSAIALIQSSGMAAVDLHVFTDGMAPGWSLPETDVLAWPPGARLILYRCGDVQGEEGGLVRLEQVKLPSLLPVAGQPMRLQVQLQNPGERPAEVWLTVEIEGMDAPVREGVRLAAHATQVVERVVPLPASGPAHLHVFLDGLTADPAAHAWRSIPVLTGAPVLLVGHGDDFGLLPAALSPGGRGDLSGLDAQLVASTDLSDTRAGPPPRMIVFPWHHASDPDLAQWVLSHAASGASLLLFPVHPDADTHVLPDWSGVRRAVPVDPDPAQAVQPASPDDPLWHDLRDADGMPRVTGMVLHHAFGLESASPETRELLRMPDGEVILTVVPRGRGRIYVSGIGWDLRWSNLPRRAVFLALAHAMARGVDTQEFTPVVRAGETARFRSMLDAAMGPEAVVRVMGLAGDTLHWAGTIRDVSAPARAGLVRVVSDDVRLDVVVDGDSRAVRPVGRIEPISHLAGRPFDQVVDDVDPVQAVARLQHARRDQPFMGVLLVLALLAALAETFLANRLLTPDRGAMHGKQAP